MVMPATSNKTAVAKSFCHILSIVAHNVFARNDCCDIFGLLPMSADVFHAMNCTALQRSLHVYPSAEDHCVASLKLPFMQILYDNAENGSRFRLLGHYRAHISVVSWGIVVPFCIVNRFAMTKAMHTPSNTQRQYHINLYL